MSFILLGSLLSCKSVSNFTEPDGPVWKELAWSVDYDNPSDLSKLVSYNIKFAKEIDLAINELQEFDALKNVELLLLQEMDTTGSKRIAEALSMNYVYMPFSLHGKEDRYFGNAILSKWPIVKFEKIVLPHLSRKGRHRMGIYAEVEIKGTKMHIYNIHLETFTMKRAKRLDQLKAIIKHSEQLPSDAPVLIAGDFNSLFPKDRKVFDAALKMSGFDWRTQDFDATSSALSGFIKPPIDHIYTRNLSTSNPGVLNKAKASDHWPVFIDLTH